MSASFYASLAYGVLLSNDDLVKYTPNPLFGKFKFDPDTGKKVEEFIEERIYLEELTDKFGLQYAESTDSNYVVVGKKYGSFCIGERDSEYCSLNETPTEELNTKIKQFCDFLGIEFSVKIYAIGRCSY